MAKAYKEGEDSLIGMIRISTVPLDLITERVRETLRAFPSVKGAYLFGSALDEGPIIGDIDIGLVAPELSERDSELMAVQVEEALRTIAGKTFDVTVFDERMVPFVMNVLRQGRLVYSEDLDAVTDFIERVSLAWRDIGPRYQLARKEVLEEVRSGGH